MELNDQMISEIASQLGISGGGKVNKRDIERLEGKSDEELASEILKIKRQLKARNVSYEKQVSMVKSLMPMMDANQKARLKKIIELLEQ